MAGPKPDNNYNPDASVAPTVSAPNDYITTRANPNEFGAQVGAALESAGSKMQAGDNQLFDVMLQRQGMLNETLATDAETKAATAYAQITGDYKSKEGLQAVNDLPQTIKAIQDVRQQVGSTLSGNPAAQRAFNMLAVRREGFALQDANLYHSSQIKVADNRSAVASQQLAIDSASRPEVANDPVQFADAKTNVEFQSLRIITNQGYGQYAHQDPKTGDVSFDESAQGQQAKAVYDEFNNKALGQIYENKYRTLLQDPSSGNTLKAVNLYNQEKDKIPAEAQARIGALLYAPVRNAQSRDVADNVVNEVNQGYNSVIGNSLTGKVSPDQVWGSVFQQESSSGKNAKTSIDGAVGPGQIKPETFALFAKPGESVTNPADNIAVSKRMISSYMAKYNNDPQRAMVAYFSGPGNVAPPGSPTPYINDTHDGNGKYVSSYLADNTSRLQSSGSPTVTGGNYISKSDYIKNNWDSIMQRVGNDIDSRYPNDAVMHDAAVSHAEQQLGQVIKADDYRKQANRNLVLRAVEGEFNSDKQPLTSINQLDNQPPDVKNALHEFMLDDPAAPQKLNNMLSANLRGTAKTYGTDFYKYFTQAASGKLQDITQVPVGQTENDPVTNTGWKVIKDIHDQASSPQNSAFLQQELQFFNKLHNDATGQAMMPGLKSGKLEADFSKQMQVLLPLIDAGKREGKNSGQLFNPESPEYIGKYYEGPKEQTIMDEIQKSILFNNNSSTTSNQSFNSLSDLQKAVQDKKIPRQQAINLAKQKGWVTDNPPPVPGAHDGQ